jgi:hypothetical protein
MERKIQTALEWPDIRSDIRARLAKIAYNHDLYKMLSNVDTMVTELSKAEVTARQRKNDAILTKQIEDINSAIHYIDKMLLYFILVN